MRVSNKVDIFKNTYTIKIIFTIGSILLIKNIKADMSIIFHFYDPQNQQECNLNCNKEEKMQFSNFIKQRYNCYEHEECIECTRYIIKDPSELILNLDDNKSNENNEKKIYICTDVCKYEDFLYFLKILNEIHDFKENLQVDDFILLIHILDMFKFKKDKKFKQLIRIILLSIIYNCQKNYNKGDLTKKNYISSSLFNCILYEFRKIYFFDLKPNFDKEERVSGEHIKNLIVENFDENFCSGKTYVSIKSEFLIKLSKYIKYNKEFRHGFKNIFKWIKPLRVALDSINSTSDVSTMLMSLIYFIPGEELCFQSWKNAVQLQYMLENFGFEKIRTLFFIDCNFLSFYESYFESFRSLKFIYLFNCQLLNTTISENNYKLVQNIVSIVYNEVEKLMSISKSAEKNINEPFESKLLNGEEFESSMKIFSIPHADYFRKIQIFFANTMPIYFPFVKFELSVLNPQKIRNIAIVLKRFCLSDLNFEGHCVNKNLKSLEIQASCITDELLYSVLLLSNLKKIILLYSKIILKNHETNYRTHILLQELVISWCNFENQERIFKFINSFPNLKSLQITYNKGMDLFRHVFNYNMIKLVHLEKFIFEQERECISEFSNFTGKNSIIELNISYGSKAGFLYSLFSNNKLQNVRKLQINKFIIGARDKNSMVKCVKIRDLIMSNCRFTDISFSELFKIDNEYAIKKILLMDMILSKRDIIFISKLKHLRRLTLNYINISLDLIDLSHLVFRIHSKINMVMLFDSEPSSLEYHFDEFFSQ
ncbi:hypothetical protein LUQ84_003093 [Hamiltosporidium tvaerminnensis]|nr:hypothetical protein LUQ84_003093 [Hamiltosporidium tvaerminnensis]